MFLILVYLNCGFILALAPIKIMRSFTKKYIIPTSRIKADYVCGLPKTTFQEMHVKISKPIRIDLSTDACQNKGAYKNRSAINSDTMLNFNLKLGANKQIEMGYVGLPLP